MKMVIFVKQPQERGTVSCFLSPLPRQLFALITIKPSFSDLGKQECQEGGILPESGMRKLTILACPVW